MGIGQQIRALKFEFATDNIVNHSKVITLSNSEFRKIKQLIKINEVNNTIKVSPRIEIIFLEGNVEIRDYV